MELVRRGLNTSRSQAEDSIKRGFIKVRGKTVTKAGALVDELTEIVVSQREQFVSRAGEKLNSVISKFKIDFRDKVVLDVGSSTGGFTELALRNGAKKVVAVDVGTDQMHQSLRSDPRIELHEKTNILEVGILNSEVGLQASDFKVVIANPDIVIVDVSFVSLREILPYVSSLMTHNSRLLAMVKPQFEAGNSGLAHKGVIKNDRMRRDILKDFETWSRQYFVLIDKADSGVAGSKGNIERFYLLKKLEH